MVYSQENSKGTKYYLHKQEVTLKHGGKSVVYYFGRNLNLEFAVHDLPEGKEVHESARSSMLLLRNKIITPTPPHHA